MRLPYRRAVLPRSLLACAVVLLALVGLAAPASAAEPVRVQEQRIEGAGVGLDTSLYLPATLPAPAVLVAHGFGGRKDTVDDDARDLAARGFVVLGVDGARLRRRAPGRSRSTPPTPRSRTPGSSSTGWPQRPEVQQDGPGDPRVGVTGGSYGGALSLLLAGYDRRVDATRPVITWNDLGQALFPNAARHPDPADTPARGRVRARRGVQARLGGLFFCVRPGRTSPRRACR